MGDQSTASTGYAAATPRVIAEIGESGATESLEIYNRRSARRVERYLKREARKKGRKRWRFPG